MKNTFREGDLLSVEPEEINKIKKGEIIAYRSYREDKPNKLIVHRIIQISNDNLYTKGDNNRRADTFPVSQGNLIGKVTAFERNGKHHRVIDGWSGLVLVITVNIFRRIGYWFFTKVQRLLPIRHFFDILNRVRKIHVQKIKVHSKEGPIIKWIFRNRTIAHELPNNKLESFSFLSRFLINSKNSN